MVQLKIECALRCDSLKYVFIDEEVTGEANVLLFTLLRMPFSAVPLQ